jgi:hypothetical protein
MVIYQRQLRGTKAGGFYIWTNSGYPPDGIKNLQNKSMV